MSAWAHYIGGKYTPEKFIREAWKYGWNRKVGINMAGAMEYGDKVLFLEWRFGLPRCFSEGVIRSIRFAPDVTAKIAEGLIASGRAEAVQGGGVVVRECGSYIDGGGVRVSQDVTLKEIVKQAKEYGATDVFIGGDLSKVYDGGFVVNPSPPFTRGFMRVNESGVWHNPDTIIPIIIDNVPDNRVGDVVDYSKRTTRSRTDFPQMKLLPGAH